MRAVDKKRGWSRVQAMGGGWGRSLSISSVARMASVVDVIEKVKF